MTMWSGWNWTEPKAKPPVAAQVPVRHAPSHGGGINWRHVLGVVGGIAAGIGIDIGVTACIAATAGICAGVAAGIGTAVAGGAAAGGVGAAVSYGVTGDNGRYSWSGFAQTVGVGALTGGIFGGAGYGVATGLSRVTALNSTRTLATNTAAGAADAGGDIVGTSHSVLRPSRDWNEKGVVDNYVSRLRAGEKLPAIQVERMRDGTEVILDGHHRYVASQITGVPVDRTYVQYGFDVGEPNWLGVSYGS